ncbi:hypothetical protein GC177_05350 [bacterium]|nr:hypothetical protein [bacterium]
MGKTMRAPLNSRLGEDYVRELADAINRISAGKIRAGGEVSLQPGATSTVVADPRCGTKSVILLSPRSASAAIATQAVYTAIVTNGAFTLAHDSQPVNDRLFDYVILG